MIVSESAGVVFIHVQKTGGNSVTNLLLSSLPGAQRMDWMRDKKHTTLDTVLRVRPAYADYFVFGFVRNPWARMWSWHSMIMRRAANQPHRVDKNPIWRRVFHDHASFESFILDGTQVIPRLCRPQLDYLRAGEREADFIGRLETLDADMATVRERLGLPSVELPHGNAGDDPVYQEKYTDAMRARVGELFAVDVERFGYRF